MAKFSIVSSKSDLQVSTADTFEAAKAEADRLTATKSGLGTVFHYTVFELVERYTTEPNDKKPRTLADRPRAPRNLND